MGLKGCGTSWDRNFCLQRTIGTGHRTLLEPRQLDGPFGLIAQDYPSFTIAFPLPTPGPPESLRRPHIHKCKDIFGFSSTTLKNTQLIYGERVEGQKRTWVLAGAIEGVKAKRLRFRIGNKILKHKALFQGMGTGVCLMKMPAG